MAAESITEQRIGALLFYGFVLLLAYLVFRVIAPFLAPLVWAGVLVVVFSPFHRKLERRWGKTVSAIASTAGVTLILVVPMILMSGAFVRQGIQITHSMQSDIANGRYEWANNTWISLENWFAAQSSTDLNSLVRDHAEEFARYLASELGVALQHLARFAFDLIVMILAMFYTFRDGQKIVARIRKLLPFEAEHRDRMIGEAHDLIFATVLSTLTTAVVHGFVDGVMFAIVGIHAALFWGVIMALCSILPVVGSSVVWGPAAIWLAAQGHISRAIVLVAACVCIAAVVENVLRPWLISGRAQLSGLVVFIGVLGGIMVFGVLGVVLGPIIIATAACVLDIYTDPGPKRHVIA